MISIELKMFLKFLVVLILGTAIGVVLLEVAYEYMLTLMAF